MKQMSYKAILPELANHREVRSANNMKLATPARANAKVVRLPTQRDGYLDKSEKDRRRHLL